jgi:hypothetical protein
LDQSKARSGRFENSPCGLRQFKALILHFAKIDAQNVLMTAQKDLSNSPFILDKSDYKAGDIHKIITISSR